MRLLNLAVAALLTGATTSIAGPLPSPAPDFAGGAAIERIHHKPGHQGGPPWTRGRSDDRRAYDQRVERSSPTRVCETQYRREYDPDFDEYVRRPVQICRTVY